MKAKVSTVNQDIEVFGSYLSDCVYDLIVATESLLKGANEAINNWQDEPGQFRWIFTRQDRVVSFQIAQFEDTFSKKRNEEGKVIFEAKVNLTSFARGVVSAMDKLRNNIDEEEYYRLWNYEFPSDRLKILREVYRSRKES